MHAGSKREPVLELTLNFRRECMDDVDRRFEKLVNEIVAFGRSDSKFVGARIAKAYWYGREDEQIAQRESIPSWDQELRNKAFESSERE